MKPDMSLQLRQIARALDVPVEVFFEEPQSDSPLAGAVELLRCWQNIATAEHRDRLLVLARELAGDPGTDRMAAE